MEISQGSNLGEIIVGTNEEFILGYNIVQNEDKSVSFCTNFTNHSHVGRVKQVATSGIFLASGGTDEAIRIFNLRNRTEIGSLHPHTGTVTCLQFHKSGYLFSGSEDGKIVILKKNKWEVERELNGHRQGITALAVHPSGRLALSTSKDKKMITWNLMKGKRAHMVSLKKAADFVIWSPGGTHYLIASANVLDMYAVASGEVVHSIHSQENVACCCFINDNLIVVGREKNALSLYDLDCAEEVTSWEAHECRTKCLVSIESSSSQDSHLVASASSDGFIKVWRIQLACVKSAPVLLGEVDTKCRVICMALSRASTTEGQPSLPPPKKKRKLRCHGLKDMEKAEAGETKEHATGKPHTDLPPKLKKRVSK